MTTPIGILLVEDDERDAELVTRELHRGGLSFEAERVDSERAMEDALGRRTWSVVLSDHSLPGFSPERALELLARRSPAVPLIVVSGTVGEERAAEFIQAGARAFVSKRNLHHLAPTLQRVLEEARARASELLEQEHVVLADRVASLGTLAAGIAHEINNPLAALVANLDIASEDLRSALTALDDAGTRHPQGSGAIASLREALEALRDAGECATRVRHIVKDLKLFSHPAEDRRSPVDVHPILESSLRMASTEIRFRARLRRAYGEEAHVLANEARLGQVFLNLLINAAQAIPEGDAENHEITVETSASEARVTVAIRDTGRGMTPEVLARAFDPFFTTKPAGVGTGLGLAICHRLVTALGGRLTLESKPGKGTTACIELPRHGGVASDAAPPSPEAPTPRRGRVLVIDDEPAIAAAVVRMLGRHHEVVVAHGGRAGLARLHGEDFDVVLCDVMMPDMSGLGVLAELERSRPELSNRVVLMTGGALTEPAAGLLGRASVRRLQKPFGADQLRALVSSLLSD